MSVSAGCQLKRIKDGPHVRFIYRERATDEKKYNRRFGKPNPRRWDPPVTVTGADAQP
jgi:hypothetical protein